MAPFGSHDVEVGKHRDKKVRRFLILESDPFHNITLEFLGLKSYLDNLPTEILENIALKTIDFWGSIPIIKNMALFSRTCLSIYAVVNPMIYRWDIKYAECRGLFWAARLNRVDVLKRFVQYGAPINKVVGDQTPALLAVISRKTDFVRHLMTLPDVDWNRKSTHQGTTVLHMVMQREDWAVVRNLLLNCEHVSVDEKTALTGYTALHYASEKNMLFEAKIILERGGDPDARNHQGWSPLNLATRYGHTDMVRLLLETGKVDVNAYPEDGQPPLGDEQ